MINTMKRILYFLAIITLLVYGCDPIEERDTLDKPLTEADLNISVTNENGGNQVVLNNSTPFTSGIWDYGIGKSVRKQDTILLPFLGTSVIGFTATADGGLVSTSKEIVISKIDHPLDSIWTLLAGETVEGKTWVWATDHPCGVAYGNGPYLEARVPEWWKVDAAALSGWGVLNDELTFNLNGSANCILTTGNTNAGEGLAAGTYNGSFSFDMKKITYDAKGAKWAIGKLTLKGTTVSRGFQPNVANKSLIYKYDILKLTKDELILACAKPGVTTASGESWYWCFKRKGFNY